MGSEVGGGGSDGKKRWVEKKDEKFQRVLVCDGDPSIGNGTSCSLYYVVVFWHLKRMNFWVKPCSEDAKLNRIVLANNNPY